MNSALVYGLPAALVFAESGLYLGFVLPGETALVTAGYLAGSGRADLGGLLAVGAAAAVGGDLLGYAIGRRLGIAVRRAPGARWLSPQHWARAERAVAEHGALAVVAARFLAVLRTLVPTLAGVARMPLRRFAVADALGGSAWSSAAVLVGVGAHHWHLSPLRLLHAGGLVVAGVLAGIAAAVAVRLWWRRRGAGPGSGRPFRAGSGT